MATPSTRSTIVEMLAKRRLFAIDETVRSWPSARWRLSSVYECGTTVPYQSCENATKTTPRWGRTATNVTPPNSRVQSHARPRGRARAPPACVAFAIIA